MIKLATIAPAELNLNGDQGNLLALQNFLSAAGFAVEVLKLEPTANVVDADFYLAGHGSGAANDLIGSWLRAQLSSDFYRLRPTMAVGSSALCLAEILDIPVTHGVKRVSEFQVASLDGLDILGYRNTDSDLDNIIRHGESLLTMLHGPVLAKNPALLEALSRKIVLASGSEWPNSEPQKLRKFKTDLYRICDRIWELEGERKAPRFDAFG